MVLTSKLYHTHSTKFYNHFVFSKNQFGLSHNTNKRTPKCREKLNRPSYVAEHVLNLSDSVGAQLSEWQKNGSVNIIGRRTVGNVPEPAPRLHSPPPLLATNGKLVRDVKLRRISRHAPKEQNSKLKSKKGRTIFYLLWLIS